MVHANFEKELVDLWEIASARLRDEPTTVNRLEELLRSKGITQESLILDTAGGFGFPVIPLAKRVYQIVYNDGSWGMLQRAFARAEEQKAPLYPFQQAMHGCHWGGGKWQDLKDFQPDSWNALLCTGNSLPYAVSWGEGNPDLTQARQAIVETLQTFYRITKEGGVIYVDKQPEAQDHIVEDVGIITYKGRRVQLEFECDNDKVQRVRKWTLRTRNLKNGIVKEFPSKGYLLLEDELVPLLEEVGFKSIEKHVLQGDIYEGFTGKK